MHRHSFKAATWAVALAAISAFTLTDPPPNGARALLGWTPLREAGTSSLRLAGTHGQVSAEQALLGTLAASEKQPGVDEAIQIRQHPVDGSSALLRRP